MDIEKLRLWFIKNRRDLPWRENASPYAVLISEVMLQQTRAAVVIPYFIRWMKKYPTIGDLALASIEEVIKSWEGLGYYSRARFLHRFAREIVSHHAGKIPSDPEILRRVKGIGPYTLGALQSFGFKKKFPAVDGNVIRVLTRYYGIEEEVTKSRTKKQIAEYAEKILPESKPWEITEGLIELGALICQKTPECARCPLADECSAKARNKTEAIPVKKPRPTLTILKRHVALVLFEQDIYLHKNKDGIMQDLWEFPFLEPTDLLTMQQEKKLLEERFGTTLQCLTHFPEISHHFTRYKAHLFPKVWRASEKSEGMWLPIEDLTTRAFSSGHRKLARMMKNWMADGSKAN